MLRFLCIAAYRAPKEDDGIRLYNNRNSLYHENIPTNHIVLWIKGISKWKLYIAVNQEQHMLDMFKSMNRRGQTLFTWTLDASSTSNFFKLLHKGGYLAETKSQIYKWSPQPVQGYNSVVTRIHPNNQIGAYFWCRG